MEQTQLHEFQMFIAFIIMVQFSATLPKQVKFSYCVQLRSYN